jgi:Na+-driven multidrug efflux pump
LSVLGTVFILDFFPYAVAEYFMTGFATRAAYLFGRKRHDMAGQLFADFLRMTLVAGALTPAVIIPLTLPVMKYFAWAAGSGFLHQCLEFLRMQSGLSATKYAYMTVCGQAQAEGASFRFAVLQLLALGVDQVSNAVLYGWLRVGVWGVPLSRAVGEGFAAIVGIVLIVRRPGLWQLRPGYFVRGFSRETWQGVKSGFAAFLTMTAQVLPMILLQKFMGDAGAAIGEYDEVMSVWRIAGIVWQLVGGACLALGLGALPAVSYAFGAGKYSDARATLGHCFGLTTMIPIILSVAPTFFPRWVASCWERDSRFLDMADAMLPPVFYGSIFIGMVCTIPFAVQGMQRPMLATLWGVVGQLLPLPVSTLVLHALAPRNPSRLMMAFTFSDGIASPFGIAVVVWVFRKLGRMPDKVGIRGRMMSLTSVRAGPGSEPGVRSVCYSDFLSSVA